MEINLKQIWRYMRPRIWIVAIAAVLGAVFMFVYTSLFVTPMYVSTGKMYVYNNDRQSAQISAGDLNASQQLVKTYIAIMQSDSVMKKVAEEVDLGYSAGQIRGMFSASEIKETEIFKISVRCANPEHAQKIADAILRVAPEPIIKTVKAGTVEIVDRASYPSAPSSPNITRETMLGFIIGAFLSAAAIILIQMLDRRIHSEEEIIGTYKLPILGIIPDISEESVEKEAGK